MALSNLKTPGVYVEEISTLPSSIAAVETAIPAFVGYTEKAIIDGVNWWIAGTTPAPAVRITSILEYQQTFGSAFPEVFNVAIVDTPATGPVVTRAITVTHPSTSLFKLFYSLQLYFSNGGGPCYIVSVGDYTGNNIAVGELQAGVEALEKEDEPTLILFPDASSLSATNYGNLAETTLAHCNKMQDRFSIFDNPVNSIASADITTYRTELGPDYLKYGASYMPFLNTVINFNINTSASGSKITSYTGADTYLATLPFLGDSANTNSVLVKNPALYNNIISQIKSEFFVTLPPSGAIAGIYARVDRERGVWKAPANVGVSAIVGPTINITSAQQESLNVDPTSGKSINAIRSFTGRGTLVWGSRTLAGNDNEWRYVPVRRLFIMVEESTKKATEFVVFEPNTANTWQRVKGMIEAFLTNIWRDGALAGATTKDAFFVNVGLGTTMTAQDILEGRMIVEIGMAAVRPAEFIVLKFEHKLQES